MNDIRVDLEKKRFRVNVEWVPLTDEDVTIIQGALHDAVNRRSAELLKEITGGE